MSLLRGPRPWATGVGLLGFSIYALWNLSWLVQGRVAPSLLTALTGLPCPTTGGTRSLRALLAGDLGASVAYHPLTVPLLVLLGISLVQIARHRRIAAWTARAWVVVLLVSWACKLLSPVHTW